MPVKRQPSVCVCCVYLLLQYVSVLKQPQETKGTLKQRICYTAVKKTGLHSTIDAALSLSMFSNTFNLPLPHVSCQIHDMK